MVGHVDEDEDDLQQASNSNSKLSWLWTRLWRSHEEDGENDDDWTSRVLLLVLGILRERRTAEHTGERLSREGRFFERVSQEGNQMKIEDGVKMVIKSRQW